jgi:hypothetical protein
VRAFARAGAAGGAAPNVVVHREGARAAARRPEPQPERPAAAEVLLMQARAAEEAARQAEVERAAGEQRRAYLSAVDGRVMTRPRVDEELYVRRAPPTWRQYAGNRSNVLAVASDGRDVARPPVSAPPAVERGMAEFAEYTRHSLFRERDVVSETPLFVPSYEHLAAAIYEWARNAMAFLAALEAEPHEFLDADVAFLLVEMPGLVERWMAQNYAHASYTGTDECPDDSTFTPALASHYVRLSALALARRRGLAARLPPAGRAQLVERQRGWAEWRRELEDSGGAQRDAEADALAESIRRAVAQRRVTASVNADVEDLEVLFHATNARQRRMLTELDAMLASWRAAWLYSSGFELSAWRAQALRADALATDLFVDAGFLDADNALAVTYFERYARYMHCLHLHVSILTYTPPGGYRRNSFCNIDRASFDQFESEVRMHWSVTPPPNARTQFRQMFVRHHLVGDPVSAHRARSRATEQVPGTVTLMNRTCDAEYVQYIISCLEDFDFSALIDDHEHVACDLLYLFTFCVMLGDRTHAEVVDKYVLLSDSVCTDARLTLRRSLLRAGTRMPVIAFVLGQWRVFVGDSEQYHCYSARHAVLVWCWVVHHSYDATLKDGDGMNLGELFARLLSPEARRAVPRCFCPPQGAPRKGPCPRHDAADAPPPRAGEVGACDFSRARPEVDPVAARRLSRADPPALSAEAREFVMQQWAIRSVQLRRFTKLDSIMRARERRLDEASERERLANNPAELAFVERGLASLAPFDGEPHEPRRGGAQRAPLLLPPPRVCDDDAGFEAALLAAAERAEAAHLEASVTDAAALCADDVF